MLRLPPNDPQPKWVDLLPGVRLQVRPVSIPMILAARSAAGLVYREKNEAADPSDIASSAMMAMVASIARSTIVDWEGVGDSAEEPAPLPVTPANVDALMRFWPAFEAFDRIVVSAGFGGDA